MFYESENPVVFLGNHVALHNISFRDAVDRSANDEYFTNLSDDRLEQVILEADQHWREMITSSGVEDENFYRTVRVFPALMVSSATARRRNIQIFVDGADPVTSAMLHREERWIVLSAHCLCSVGLAGLLVPDPKFAHKNFREALQAAASTRGQGKIRLKEALYATLGMLLAGDIGRQPNVMAEARMNLARLHAVPGREHDIAVYIREISQEFDIVRKNLEQRWAPSTPGVTPDQMPASSLGDVHHYAVQIQVFADRVLNGNLTLDQARAEVVGLCTASPPSLSAIYSLTRQHISVPYVDAARTVILATLNYAVASSLAPSDDADIRGYCAHALGRALHAKAIKDRGAATFREPVAYLEEVLRLLMPVSGDAAIDIVDDAYLGLAECHRQLGDLERASHYNKILVERATKRSGRQFSLGCAYGSLGSIEEARGSLATAYDYHYTSFRFFADIKDLLDTRSAINRLYELSIRIGRFDDTIAAGNVLIRLMTDAGDFNQLASTYLLLAKIAFQTNNTELALGMMDQAYAILPAFHDAKNRDTSDAKADFDLLITDSMLSTAIYEESHKVGDQPPIPFERIFNTLESSRRLALELKDDQRLAESIIRMAILYRAAGRFDAAESLCLSVDLIPCNEDMSTARDEQLCKVFLETGRVEEAILVLRPIVGRLTHDTVMKLKVLETLAAAYRKIGRSDEEAQTLELVVDSNERMRAVLDESRVQWMGRTETAYERLISLYSDPSSLTFNPERALHCLERSKARTLAEALGLGYIPLPGPPDVLIDPLKREAELLERVRGLRREGITARDMDPEQFGTRAQLHTTFEELQSLWEQMAVNCPEYIELRRGTVIDWTAYQEVLAE